ncbi:MAG: hypothetical protein BWY11_00707 [Firmicutes bacterium ADurb.Bin182]|nr:MAG: hypothetical protein BWY11_00707 [Firmicutes bacterium ADurb.Bin182]
MNEIDMNAAREFVYAKLRGMGDYSFIKGEDMSNIVNELIRIDSVYMEQIEKADDGLYDDDAAYELLFEGLRTAFPPYKMWAMRLTEDYMDAIEQYLDDAGAIEWE